MMHDRSVYCAFVALAAACFLAPWSAARAQEPGEQDDQARQQRLQFMRRTVEDFLLAFQDAPGEPLTLTESPVLRFSNPVRDSFSDGTIFLWLDGRRPVAAASLWIRANGESGHDFACLSGRPLQCVRDGRVEWSPRQGVLVNQLLSGAPEPGRTPQQRLSQMRRLAARFSGEIGAWPAEGFRELRLMPRPIYRYASQDDGVVDGAIFALALANDPEVLVQLELARDPADGTPPWSYSVARMSALRMKVRLDQREIWSTGGYWLQPRSPDDPYLEAFDERFMPQKQ